MSKPKDKHKGCIRAYIRSSKTYYARALNDQTEVNFGMYALEGGTSGEMQMTWKDLGGELSAQLKSYYDSWSALALFTDVIQEMGKVDDQAITEEQFVAILDKCGFKDLTEYANPNPPVKNEPMVTLTIPKSQAKKLKLIK